MAKGLKWFTDEDAVSKGGGLYPEGPSRFNWFRFGTFDYGKPGNDQNCLIAEGQPLNSDGTDMGEPRLVYWPTTKGENAKGDTVLVDPVKGEKGRYKKIDISESNKYGKLFGVADFCIWLDHLKAAYKLAPDAFDPEEIETDITVLDGLTVEVIMHSVEQKKRATVKDDDKKEAAAVKSEPWRVVVFAEILDPKKMGKGGSKKAAAKEEEAPAKKATGKKKEAELSDDPDEIVLAYIDDVLDDDMDGSQALSFKVGVSDWASKKGKDADVCRAAQSSLKENVTALLKTKGWSIQGGKLSKDE